MHKNITTEMESLIDNLQTNNNQGIEDILKDTDRLKKFLQRFIHPALDCTDIYEHIQTIQCLEEYFITLKINTHG